jgi:intracellular sulfur oxidation DsrE/DsrF family protein
LDVVAIINKKKQPGGARMSKNYLTIAAAALLAVSQVGCSSQQQNLKAANNGYHQQRVVYHVNNIDQAWGALRNVKNHLNALGDENIEVVVVTHSSGAFTLVDGSTDSKGHTFDAVVQQLANRGVKFQICANTIRGKKIDKDKINLNAEIVPSGVAQVADLQQKGYLYVKP